MQKYFPVLLLTACLAVAACAQTKSSALAQAPEKTAPAIQTPYDWVKIQRTACFGRCPIYWIKVWPNGTVQYFGKSFVPATGLYEKQFDPADVKGLFAGFEQNRVDTCRERYEMRVQDLPGLIIEFSFKGEKKRILNASFGPYFLRQLAENADKLLPVDASWKHLSATEQEP